MKKKILLILAALTAGLVLTSATLLFNKKSSFDGCEGFGLHQVQKGLPLPIILVRPSVSLCNSVESISILWEGNAYHEQYPLNIFVDVMFWSVISALVAASFTKLRKSK